MIELFNELLPSISWSLIGFLIGWLVGREMLFVHRVKESAMHDEDVTGGGVGSESSSGADRSSRVPKPPSSRWLGIIVSIMAVVTVLQGTYYTWETKKTLDCQAKFNADFAAVLSKRAQWAEEDKAAEIKLWKDFLTSKPTQARTVLQEYLVATDRTDKLRAENPLPKLEDRNC